MQTFTTVLFWKEAPFIRLIVPFLAGIVMQWYGHTSAFTGWVLLMGSCISLFVFSFSGSSVRFSFQWINGCSIHGIIVAVGMLITYHTDIRYHSKWASKYYSVGNTIIASIEEPLSEKKRSYRTLASVQVIIRSNGVMKASKGNILVYFEKDAASSLVQYGDQLVFFKSLQPVKNSGNPGSFDYLQYCAFRNTHHQVYLKQGEYVIMKIKNANVLKKFLFEIRTNVISILKKFIPGTKEVGLAEAMLIGYKDDLDKNLVQSYSATGVVHIIAISGLHLALIYWLLNMLTKPLEKLKRARYVKPLIIISGLWLFSLAAGASPSVLRAALMFTCLVIGNNLYRKTPIYNSLAASAFLLLCINPFWLWDAGFQLSYAAVLSIVLFMKPIYNCWYVRNKAANHCWKLLSVTMAAQILTAPICLYHFHQFPTLFLFTNLVAVPLSSLILFGEIILCAIAWLPTAGDVVGWCLSQSIRFMNNFVEFAGQLPFAVWQGIQINSLQVLLLYAFIAFISLWWFYNNRRALLLGLITLLSFVIIRAYSFAIATKQQQLIVYNVPKQQAIDFIAGRNYFFKGDSILTHDEHLKNFHLTPSRILHRVTPTDSLQSLSRSGNVFRFGKKSVLIIDSAMRLQKPAQKINMDIIILSKNAAVDIKDLYNTFECQQVVIDGSNSLRRTKQWKQDCSRLGIACHTVTDEGAFVFNPH
jgi:competence protein ComEC